MRVAVHRLDHRASSIVAVGVCALWLLLGSASRGQVNFESESHITVNSADDILLTKPVGTATGDLLIAAVAVDDHNGLSLSAPSGWTLINKGSCPNDGGIRCTLGAWWKIVPPGEVGFWIFTWGGNEPASGAILRYSGADTSSPIGSVTSAAGREKANPPSQSPAAPSVTTTVDDSVVLRVLGNDRLGPYTPDAGHASRHTDCNSSPDPNKVCLALADKSQATAGSAGGMSWSTTASGTNIFWRSLSIEIIPPQPRGDVEVFKHTLPDGDGEIFEFNATGLTPTSFDLMDDESRLFSGVPAGSGLYSVSEVVPADWTRISYCDIGFPGNVEVVTGATTECHFVNVDETQVPRCDMVGPVDTSIGAGGNADFTGGLYFDALAPFVLKAVDVYPSAAGNVVVNLKKNGTLLASRSVAVNPSVARERTRIELDLPVAAGTGYRLDNEGSSTGGLYRNSSGPSYPYAGEFVEITGSTAGSSFYYFFYDWGVERMDAVGPASREFGAGAYTVLDWQLEFAASEPTRIHSAHVYPGSAGNVVIELLNSSDIVIDSVVQSVPAELIGAKTPIELDFLVPAGSDYGLRLGASTTATLWRNFAGTAYPFSTSSLSITGNSFGNSAYYYFFFDWLFTPARVGWDVRLHDLTIDEAMTVRACKSATLGPDLHLVFPADVSVAAGEQISLESPVETGADARLEMKLDPALLPD